jgi:acetamidase/formamidase
VGFDTKRQLGVTLDEKGAERVAAEADKYAALPETSIQNSILNVAPADLPGMVVRLRPFMGQLGTTPARPWPDSHNAGDFAQFLIDAPHEYGL